jgi:hypothetical protein
MPRRLPTICCAALLVVSGCDDNVITTPDDGSAITGAFELAWTTTVDAPRINVLGGLSIRIDDCGNGDVAPNATFAFDPSSVLALQEAPQAYSLTLAGEVVACDGTPTPFFDVMSGDYLLVEETRLTLQGDATHPHLVGEVTPNDENGTVEIRLRAGQPGLAYPLWGIDILCFSQPIS